MKRQGAVEAIYAKVPNTKRPRMKSLSILGFALVMFLALGIVSVYANTADGNLGLPILGTTGAPALAAPSLFSGVISVLHADGTPVVLEGNHVNLNLCNGSSCASVSASLKQTSPGTYTYSFTPPSLTGTVTIYIRANSLADDNGRIFPSVDTSIGTYVFAPSSSQSATAPAGNPVTPPLTAQAPDTNPTPVVTSISPAPAASPVEPLLVILSVLTLAGSFLLASKRR